MDCLKGYIGLSSKVEATAESGLYVDTLPDISLQLSEATPEDGKQDLIELWKEVEHRGILKFRTLFTAEVNRCHRINDRTIIECLICSNKELLAETLWYLLGAELLLENLGSPRINRFTTLDRNKNREFHNELMTSFSSELSTAVAGIDIHHSECIHSEIEDKNIITTQFVYP